MADEVIIVEMKKPSGRGANGNLPLLTEPITTQVVDIATLSAALNASTQMIRIRSRGTGFWYKLGDSSVSAAADTNGNIWLPADQFEDIEVDDNFTHIDTAADA